MMWSWVGIPNSCSVDSGQMGVWPAYPSLMSKSATGLGLSSPISVNTPFEGHLLRPILHREEVFLPFAWSRNRTWLRKNQQLLHPKQTNHNKKTMWHVHLDFNTPRHHQYLNLKAPFPTNPWRVLRWLSGRIWVLCPFGRKSQEPSSW